MRETKCTHKYKDAHAVHIVPKHLFIVSSVCQECYYTEHFVFHEADYPTADDAINHLLNHPHIIPDIIGYTRY